MADSATHSRRGHPNYFALFGVPYCEARKPRPQSASICLSLEHFSHFTTLLICYFCWGKNVKYNTAEEVGRGLLFVVCLFVDTNWKVKRRQEIGQCWEKLKLSVCVCVQSRQDKDGVIILLHRGNHNRNNNCEHRTRAHTHSHTKEIADQSCVDEARIFGRGGQEIKTSSPRWTRPVRVCV